MRRTATLVFCFASAGVLSGSGGNCSGNIGGIGPGSGKTLTVYTHELATETASHPVARVFSNEVSEAHNIWKGQCQITIRHSPVAGVKRLNGVTHTGFPVLLGEEFAIGVSSNLQELQRNRKNPNALTKRGVDAFATLYLEDQFSGRVNGRAFLATGIVMVRAMDSPYYGQERHLRTLAHEIGHLLMGAGHESDPNNLMSDAGSGTTLTPEQCQTARNNQDGYFE